MMIGQTLWTEFFLNKDWPVASSIAIVLLAVLLTPILFYQRMQTHDLSERT
jgi:putrescine transport system permease protein